MTTTPIRKWKRNELIVGRCWDCDLRTDDQAWIWYTIPQSFWELINPSMYPAGGVLCISCAHRRLAFLGLAGVPIDLKGCRFEPSETEIEIEIEIGDDAGDHESW